MTIEYTGAELIEYAFVIVSKDGRKRTNVIVQEK